MIIEERFLDNIIEALELQAQAQAALLVYITSLNSHSLFPPPVIPQIPLATSKIAILKAQRLLSRQRFLDSENQIPTVMKEIDEIKL